MSTGTTIYVRWFERESQRVFTENITSIHAAEGLHKSLLRIEANWPEAKAEVPAFRRFWNSISNELSDSESALRSSAHTLAEQEQLKQLSSQLAALRSLINPLLAPAASQEGSGNSDEELNLLGGKMRQLTAEISATAGGLKSFNQKMRDGAVSRQSTISEIVFGVRMLILVTGPIAGVWIGWRLSERLRKSVTQIAVTLQQNDDQSTVDLGSVVIPANSVLGSVQQQAEQVVSRLARTLKELQLARNEVVRSERLAAVGELAAGIAHELRNPLTSVKLLLQNAVRKPDSPGLNVDKSRFILEEVARMEATIQSLLDFSRLRNLNRSRHDLRATLRRAMNLVEGRARQNHIKISFRDSPAPLLVNADVEQVHQVLVNLLINGIESMPNGGDLKIHAGMTDDESHVRIIIHDSGAGIPAEVLPRLFEPFATSKERGTGLGLAVSRRIIDEHGGVLLGANDPSGGAVFTVELAAEGHVDSEPYQPASPSSTPCLTEK